MIFKQIQKTIMLFAIISIGTVYSVFAQLSMANGTKEVIVPNTQTYDLGVITSVVFISTGIYSYSC